MNTANGPVRRDVCRVATVIAQFTEEIGIAALTPQGSASLPL
jgi:hypothetical protein